MILQGEMARMGIDAWAAYCSIKAHTSLKDGESFPGIETIAKDMAKSKPTAERAVRKLIDQGYVERGRKRGRAGTFKIKERIPMLRNGEVVAVGERHYAPFQFGKFLEQIEAYAKTGATPSDGKISINFTVNVINQGDNSTANVSNVTVNGSGFVEDKEEIQQKLREALRSLGRI